MAQNSVVAEGEEMNKLLDEYLNIISGDGSGGESPYEPDTTPPSISLQTSSTEDTITVIVTATDESGLAESETYTYYLDNLQQGVATTENTKTYTGLQSSTEYTIKVVVKDKFDNPAEEEIKVSTTEPEVPDMGDAKPNPDQDGPEYGTNTPIQDDQGNTVIIPGGFHLDKDSGTSVEEGIVIEDTNGNQFVWIPTGTYQTSTGAKTNNLSRRTFTSSGATEVSGDNVAYGYGGFYIGRYEQGTGNVCKVGVEPYTNITRDIAKNQSEAMYSGKNNNVISELISSYAWDTALNFICQTNSVGYTLATTTDRTYGNLYPGSKQNTGTYVADNYSNIYDLLGNCYEWSTEYSSNSNGPYVIRGGVYDGSNRYASVRGFTSGPNVNVSFRIQLYIK